MYTIYLDEETGLAKVMTPTKNGQQLHASFATIEDFCNAFAANAKVQTPILPPSCFKYASSNDGINLFMFYPEREIDFQIRTYGNPQRSFKINIPNTVIKIILSQPNDNKASIVNGFIYFTDSILPTSNMKLYVPPFPNIYTDAKICFGSVDRGRYNMDNLFGIDAVHSMFFNNVANSDLWRGQSIDGRDYDDPNKFLEKLESLSKEEQFKVYFSSSRFKTLFAATTI